MQNARMHKPAEASGAADDAAAPSGTADEAPTDSLFAQLYDELHRLARRDTARRLLHAQQPHPAR